MDVGRSLLFLLLTSIFLLPSHSQSSDSFTSVLVSQNGLDFVKNLLVNKAIASIIPLQIPRIEKYMRIPFLGGIDVVVSNLTIYELDVASSYVKLGDTGVVILASGTTCDLSMNWHYSYSTWFPPIEISDQGIASVQVEGMEIGLSLGLKSDEGGLKLSLSECGCHVNNINIELEGGASWFYQGMVNAFKDQIGSSVESTIAKKLTEGVSDLDSFLQSLPKEIPVDDKAALNVTFTTDPILKDSSITFEIDGLFNKRKTNHVLKSFRESVSSVICPGNSKMLGISVDEAVFNSAAALYYNAEFMQWVVDKIPEQSLLNTAKWRFIIPQLYKKYPNQDMNLKISLSSPPLVKISEQYVGANVNTDLVINVLEANKVIPVACISLVIRGSGALQVMDNNLGGSVSLQDFSMTLKWSNIGNLHLHLLQPIVWTVIQTVFVPYANDHLEKGFPLPIIHGFTLQNTEIICSSSEITVCSDVAYLDSSQLPQSHLSLPRSMPWKTK
ncbi:PREDICTED: putative BPI/LBP family protein At1g04970 isoform X2 [Camelina sativa]|uniref:BPI/LBP family protein At1g04970 isoform X1 n=1 Tax=Camelina sativa TaxID=90675 RepID=A0ABM0VKG4_CAMSA|nr:PREDICTED: putative BPI/LBP family protein At1g04970 isoform X1 [Camelina sativa]XP_010457567.1 PREDICTED: putative BPI/LBP family protein At1g04970 isoform X2 [Camelina sativa]